MTSLAVPRVRQLRRVSGHRGAVRYPWRATGAPDAGGTDLRPVVPARTWYDDVGMTNQRHSTEVFRSARDLLLAAAHDYAAASRDFSWPQLGEFNWALDWFDVLAREHPDRLALWIVTEDGPDTRLSYAELSVRSDQVATWLRGLGVGRGDRMLLMLGNQAPLWEVILAAMKLGAVIIPATTLLGPDDIADRISRGGVRHVITESDETGKFAGAR